MASAAPVIDDDPPASDPPVKDPPASDPPAKDPPASDPPAKDPPADDFRARLSGGDDKLGAFLGRFASEKAVVERLKGLEDDLKGGKYLPKLGADPSEKDLKAYREVAGVPDKPEGYLEKLSDGLVVGEADRPVVDKFLEKMHAAHAPAAVTDAALQAYYKIVEEQDASIAESVAAARVECEETLRAEYAGDYRRNITAADSYLGTLPAEVQAAVNDGFDGKGVPLKSNPALMRYFVERALEANPLATVVSGGTNQASSIADEIATIEKRMRTDRAGYNADEAMQARHRELLGAIEKIKKQG